MEGACWNRNTKQIDESPLMQFNDSMPLIILEPHAKCNSNTEMDSSILYNAPIYRTSSRQSTTTKSGHLNNFVTHMALKSEKSSAHWIGRGVALLLESNE